MLELKKEIAEYDDFLQLDIEEEYSKLPYKTLVHMIDFCTFMNAVSFKLNMFLLQTGIL